MREKPPFPQPELSTDHLPWLFFWHLLLRDRKHPFEASPAALCLPGQGFGSLLLSSGSSLPSFLASMPSKDSPGASWHCPCSQPPFRLYERILESFWLVILMSMGFHSRHPSVNVRPVPDVHLPPQGWTKRTQLLRLLHVDMGHAGTTTTSSVRTLSLGWTTAPQGISVLCLGISPTSRKSLMVLLKARQQTG